MVDSWYVAGHLLAKSIENLDIDDNNHVKTEIIGPFIVGDPERIKYTEENGRYNLICTGGSDTSKILINYIKATVHDKDLREYQMCATKKFKNGEKQTVITGVAYAKPINLGRHLNYDPFTMDFDENNLTYPSENFDRAIFYNVFVTNMTERIISFFKDFHRAFYIDLLCSPVRSAGAGEKFIRYICDNVANTYDVIVLKSSRNPNTMAFYSRMGFEKFSIESPVYTLGEKETILMYLPIKYRKKRMRINCHK